MRSHGFIDALRVGRFALGLLVWATRAHRPAPSPRTVHRRRGRMSTPVRRQAEAAVSAVCARVGCASPFFDRRRPHGRCQQSSRLYGYWLKPPPVHGLCCQHVKCSNVHARMGQAGVETNRWRTLSLDSGFSSCFRASVEIDRATSDRDKAGHDQV